MIVCKSIPEGRTTVLDNYNVYVYKGGVCREKDERFDTEVSWIINNLHHIATLW